MLQVGGGEFLVIVLVALLFVGPEQLPSVMRRVGGWARQARDMSEGLRSEFMSGVDEVAGPMRGTGEMDSPIVPRGLARSSKPIETPPDVSGDPVTAADAEERADAGQRADGHSGSDNPDGVSDPDEVSSPTGSEAISQAVAAPGDADVTVAADTGANNAANDE